MDQPVAPPAEPTVEEIRAALAKADHRGYDAPQGDWIQNAQPVRRVDSVN